MLEDHREFDMSQAIQLPLGMASPLWLPFAAVTSAGLAFWWMTRWARPANLEAMLEAFAPPATFPVIAEPEPPTVEPLLDAAEAVAAQTEETAEAAGEILETAGDEAQRSAETVVEPAAEIVQEIAPGGKKKPKTAPEAPLH
jgi:hypothetical protein